MEDDTMWYDLLGMLTLEELEAIHPDQDPLEHFQAVSIAIFRLVNECESQEERDRLTNAIGRFNYRAALTSQEEIADKFDEYITAAQEMEALVG